MGHHPFLNTFTAERKQLTSGRTTWRRFANNAVFQLKGCCTAAANRAELITANIYSKHKRPHQVSLLILHPRRPDQMALLPPPVPEAAEEVVGEEAADGVSDDVDVDGLLDPEPFQSRQKKQKQKQKKSKDKKSELQPACSLPPVPQITPPLTW